MHGLSYCILLCPINMNKYFISTKKNNPNLFVLKTKVLKNLKYRCKTTFFNWEDSSVSTELTKQAWAPDCESGTRGTQGQSMPAAQSFGSQMEDKEIAEFPEACRTGLGVPQKRPCSIQDGQHLNLTSDLHIFAVVHMHLHLDTCKVLTDTHIHLYIYTKTKQKIPKM